MNMTDQRIYVRSTCFLLHDGHTALPDFAFRASTESLAIAALVIDISEGGLQILSQPEDILVDKRFAMELMHGPQDDAIALHTCEIEWVWSCPQGMYIRNGFAFSGQDVSNTELLTQLNASEHHAVRCVLHPLN